MNIGEKMTENKKRNILYSIKKTNDIPLGSYWLACIVQNVVNKSGQGQDHNMKWDVESL